MKQLLTKQKAKEIGIRIAGTLAIPIVFAVVLLIVCAAGGKTMISGASGFSNFLIYAGIITITTFALSINLGSGRFDFSLGSMAVLSTLISVRITSSMPVASGTAIINLLLCIVIGAILGAASGGLYVFLKIPPIITSLGVTLIFEGITYSIASGKYINGGEAMAIYNFMNNNWWFALIIIAVALAVMIFVFDHTKFGRDYSALKEGQKVSVNTGIKEIPNAIVCYVICGALMGVVGFLSVARSGGLDGRSLSFGSIGIMFNAFLPMFIGGFIGRFSNDKLGYLLAGLSMSMLNSTFAAYINEVSTSTQSIINAVLLVVFLIYLSNEQTCKDLVTGRLFKKWYIAIKTKSADRKARKGA